MFLEPFLDFGMLVRGVVVGDDFNGYVLRGCAPYLLEEGDPFLVRVHLMVVVYDLAGEIVKSREKGCRPMPCVVVRLSSDVPDAERETWLRPFERLALRFLVATEHDGLFGRVEVEAYHVPELLGEVRILGHLERPDEVRLDAAFVPKESNCML